MGQDRPFMGRVTVRFRRRDDGGLRAYCGEVPGFFLSSIDRRAVMNDVIPALEMLLKSNFNLVAQVSPLGHGIFELIERTEPKLAEMTDVLSEYVQEYAVERVAA